ncbi:MAG TPA: T9SS type A sorting domain-containing protein [Saprospiraceae bacterium]|nr:T9SS type A sorting domain-containing protein [Saprospiraceae bacterium]
MNKFWILFMLSLSVNAYSQKDYCGAINQKSEWLVNYQKTPGAYELRFDDTLYIPIGLTVVGDDEGKKRMGDLNLIKILNILNEDYAEAKIRFFLPRVVRHEFYSKWSEHATVLEGADMMFELNQDSVINCYFLLDAAGNCGYNLPYGGMVVSNNCASLQDHTWAHEMGHGLSLPHPFYGWEGGVSWDGSVSHNYSNPAPEYVLADYTNFKDTLIRDTLIIDTILVEKIDGSNCHLAADGFCDTKPDYLYTRWSCTSTNAISQQVQTDPNGEKFQSDGTLIMSYADDKCAARFSEEQMAAMRANFLNEKSQLNYGQVPRNAITSFNIDHIKPFYEETVNYQNINLQWSQVENADYYLVQFSKYSQFSIISLDTIVENNEMLVPQLENDSKWYWRVMPFNAYNFDIQFSNGSLFFTSEMVSTSELSSTIKAWPNPVLKGEFNISLDHNEKIENIEVYDISGRHILLDMNINGSMASIETKNLNMGVFIVRINTDKQYYTLRMMVE